MFADDDPAAAPYTTGRVRVKVADGCKPPGSITSFNKLQKKPYEVPAVLLRNMQKQRLQTPTMVQRHAIPAIIKGGWRPSGLM